MSWLSRLKNALNPRRLDDDLAEEMRDHMERRAADLRGARTERPEAQRQAALTLRQCYGIAGAEPGTQACGRHSREPCRMSATRGAD